MRCGADSDPCANSEFGRDGYRPTINTYQYADAVAISEMCKLTGDVAGAEYFAKEAEKQKAAVNEKLWDAKDSFYKVIRKNTTEKISARELLGISLGNSGFPTILPSLTPHGSF